MHEITKILEKSWLSKERFIESIMATKRIKRNQALSLYYKGLKLRLWEIDNYGLVGLKENN